MKNGNVVKGSYAVEILPKDEAQEVNKLSSWEKANQICRTGTSESHY